MRKYLSLLLYLIVILFLISHKNLINKGVIFDYKLLPNDTYAVTKIDYKNKDTKDESLRPVSIKIPATYQGKKVTGIKQSAFGYLMGYYLQEITIPKTIEFIEDFVFNDLDKLNTVYFDGTVSDWMNIDFGGCSSNPAYKAREFYFRNRNKKYDKLTEIIIPEGIKEIKDYVFAGFSQIKKIVIPEGVEKIGEQSFFGIFPVEDIYIPKSLKFIEDNAFESFCVNNIYYNGSINDYVKIEYDLEYEIKKKLIEIHFLEGKKFYTLVNEKYEELTTITIPDNVTTIKPFEYYGINGPTKIIIPSNVKIIGEYAFSHCSKVEEVVIEEGVEKISHYAFGYILIVNRVYIPKSVEIIEQYSFEGSIMPNASIYIGASSRPNGWEENWLFYGQNDRFYRKIFNWNVSYEEYLNK